MTNRTSRSPAAFFVLVFVLSVPFWLAGPVLEHALPQDVPINLPVSAVQFLNPLIAALLLTYRERGATGVRQLLWRAFDVRRMPTPIWYLPMFLLMPLIMALAFGVLRIREASSPPLHVPLLQAPILFLVFFVSGACEEIGWQGYAYAPLERRGNALSASLIIGVVWAVWHIVPYTQAYRPAAWILWQCIYPVGLRVLIVWIFKNAGNSVFAATVFHTMSNVSTFLPNGGAFYDPMATGLVITVAAALVTIVWRPGTLASYRFAQRHRLLH